MTTMSDHAPDPASARETSTSAPRGWMIIKIVGGLLLDTGLSLGTYLVARTLGYSIFFALLAGMIVAGIRAAYVIIRRRTVDGFVLFMIFTFAVGLALSFLGGTPRFLLAKDSIGTAVSGIAFGVTLFTRRPMMFYFSQRFAAPTAQGRQEWLRLWDASPPFRWLFRRLTLVWAIAFAVEAVVKLVLILALPVALMAPLSHFFTPVLITGLLVWTMRYSAAAERSLRSREEDPGQGGN